MNYNSGIGIPIVLVTIALIGIIGGIAYVSLRPQDARAPQQPAANTILIENGDQQRNAATTSLQEAPSTTSEAAEPSEIQDTQQQAPQFTGTRIAGTTAPLLDFNQADFEQAQQSGKLILLYFYANWCPTCKKETSEALYPAFNELTTDQVVGFRVNFNDDETDSAEKQLAQKHGIAYQHTKVFIKNGVEVLKAPNPWTKDRYLTEIPNALAQ